MASRRRRGGETWNRLLNWSDGQKSEQLGAQILHAEKFSSIDPSHPLGGRDGGKDIICTKDNTKWAAACYFPNGTKPFVEIRNKFLEDSKGAINNQCDGFIFITNQYLRESERKLLIKSLAGLRVEILHLGIIANILDRPENYGVRLEYLDIEMSKEEQIAFFAAVTNFTSLANKISHIEESQKKFVEDTTKKIQENLEDIKKMIQESLSEQRRQNNV